MADSHYSKKLNHSVKAQGYVSSEFDHRSSQRGQDMSYMSSSRLSLRPRNTVKYTPGRSRERQHVKQTATGGHSDLQSQASDVPLLSRLRRVLNVSTSTS